MIKDRTVNVTIDTDGNKLVLINDIRFKGKRKEENSEIIYIGNEFPEEFTESESRKALMGTNAKAKANAAAAIPELIQIATNPSYEENRKEKHDKNRKMVGTNMIYDLRCQYMKIKNWSDIMFSEHDCLSIML